jgi:bifunctional UDP-N-acetylglucosamine pyrophosphorylase/glucosamine-1-phosphate N-acetyltransferase
MVKDKVDSAFMCMYGDVVLTKESVKGMVEHHKKVKGSIMALTTVDDPKRYGVITVKDGVVTEIVEKPESPEANTVNAGAYILEPEIFEAIAETKKSPRGEFEITDSFKKLMAKTHLFGHLLKGEWIDVARPWDLLEANRILMEDLEKDIKGEVSERATVIGNIQVGEGAKVLPGSYIIGPAIIGEDSEIGPNAYIRPSTSIGEHCKIGAAVEIKNSIIMDRTNVPHLSYVGDSVIGERCNLGAGTKVANLRLDEREVQVVVDGRKVGSGRRKLGVIMGDDVKTGINSTIDVGTIIGEGTMIGIGALARGTIAPKSRIF